MKKTFLILLMGLLSCFAYSQDSSLESYILSKKFDKETVIKYLNNIEEKVQNGINFQDVLSSLSEVRKTNDNVDVALLLYQEFEKTVPNIPKSNSNITFASYNTTTSSSAGIKYSRQSCIAYIGVWVPCDQNCKPLGGKIYAGCNTYTQECFVCI